MSVAAAVLGVVNILLWAGFFMFYTKKFSPSSTLEAIRGEVNAMLADIRRETDTSATILESRLTGLKELLAQADSRILLAQKADEARQREQDAMAALSRQGLSGRGAPGAAAYEYEKLFSLPGGAESAGPGLWSNDGAEGAMPGAIVSPGPSSTEGAMPGVTGAARGDSPPPPRETVLELFRAGFDSEYISQKLRLSVREVELITGIYGTPGAGA